MSLTASLVSPRMLLAFQCLDIRRYHTVRCVSHRLHIWHAYWQCVLVQETGSCTSDGAHSDDVVCPMMQARLEQAAQRVMAERASRAASQAQPRMPSLGTGMGIIDGSQSQSQVLP
jgi:hypothetical protein